MAFTATGGILTITSGIEQLSTIQPNTNGYVTVDNSNIIPVYTINNQIIVNAGATLNITTEGVYKFPNIARSIQVGTDNGAGGNLIVGIDDGSDNPPIKISILSLRDQGLNWDADEGIFDIRGNSNISLYGIKFRGMSGLGFGNQPNDNGQLIAKNVIWDGRFQNGTPTGHFMRILGDEWDFIGGDFSGVTVFPARKFTNNKNIIVRDTDRGIDLNQGGDAQHLNFIFEGMEFSGINNYAVGITTNSTSAPRGAVVEFLNGDSNIIGTENSIQPRSVITISSANCVGTTIKTSNINVNCTDFDSGNPIDFTYYQTETDNGNRTPSQLSDNALEPDGVTDVIHHYDRDIIINEQVIGGNYNGKILKAVWNRPLSHYQNLTTRNVTPVWDLRLPVTYNIYSYNHIEKSETFNDINGEVNRDFQLEKDKNVTDTLVNVQSYTEINNSQELYDYIKYLTTNVSNNISEYGVLTV